jgi:hypothetical protein
MHYDNMKHVSIVFKNKSKEILNFKCYKAGKNKH